MGLPYDKIFHDCNLYRFCMICDGQTDRRTDGR